MKKSVIIFLLNLFILTSLICEAKNNDKHLDFDAIKSKTKKIFSKEEEKKPKMVETVEEWKTQAQNVPIEEREFKKEEEKIDTKKTT